MPSSITPDGIGQYFAAIQSLQSQVIGQQADLLRQVASAWTTFWRIKFPLILPTVGIVGILTFVGNFNAFDLIFTVKGGLAGPDFASDVMGTLFYRTFFGFQLQLGNPTMGATVATMMFVIILTGVLIYLFGWQRRVQTFEL